MITVARRTTASGAIIATAGLCVAAACGGSPQRPAAQHNGALAFARCMRSHGVPRYPDPTSLDTSPSGLPKVIPQAVGVTDSQYLAATNGCRRLLPPGAQPATRAENQQVLSKLVRFARCMRSHGVQNWPDPSRVDPVGRAQGGSPYQFDLQGLQGLDGRSFPSQVTNAMRECQRLVHAPRFGWT